MKRFGSALCQLAYWRDADLRIVNYVTGKAFSANPRNPGGPALLPDPEDDPGRSARIRFLQSRKRRGRDTEADRDRTAARIRVSGMAARQTAGVLESMAARRRVHFLTKDATYFGGDWTDEQKIQALPTTVPPASVQENRRRRNDPADLTRSRKRQLLRYLIREEDPPIVL